MTTRAERISQRRKEYYKNNPDKKLRKNELSKAWRLVNKERVKVHKLQDMYGLTPFQLEELIDKSNNCCCICGAHRSNFSRELHIDHNHRTKKVRGLLCYKCNSSLGWYEKWKNKIEEYLK